MGDFGVVIPPNKAPAPQIEIWNTISQWSFVNFQNVKPRSTNVKPLDWRLSGPFVKTFTWEHSDLHLYESIQIYIKQPVSLLGFNTAQSWKSLLWSSCGKWNEQHIAGILVVSSTILAQHGLCLTSETMLLLKCSEMSKTNSVTTTERLQGNYFSIAISAFKTQ